MRRLKEEEKGNSNNNNNNNNKTKKKKKKGLFSKTWERCKWSIGIGRTKNEAVTSIIPLSKSKSWPSSSSSSWSHRVGPSRSPKKGCFSVYVGPEMQRFVIKTEIANHPLFKMLLEEAESEYGYSSQGPLALPCNVDLFYKVIMAILNDEEDEAEVAAAAAVVPTTTTTCSFFYDEQHQGCAAGFVKLKRSRSTYHLLSTTTSPFSYSRFLHQLTIN